MTIRGTPRRWIEGAIRRVSQPHGPAPPTSGLGRRRVDRGPDAGDAVCRKSAPARVLANQTFVRSVVHAIDLVARDVAVHPLDVGAEFAEHAAGFLRNGLQIGGAGRTDVGD